jgi:transposase
MSWTAFHVVRWFASGLVAVRRRLQRREPRGHVTPAFDPEVFRSRFLALRRADRLAEAERLEAVFAAHAELARAWGMLQELHGLYMAESEEAAMEALGRFADLYQDDPVPEFYKVVDTLFALGARDLRLPQGWPVVQRPDGRDEQQARRLETHGLRLPQRLGLRGTGDLALPAQAGHVRALIPRHIEDPLNRPGNQLRGARCRQGGRCSSPGSRRGCGRSARGRRPPRRCRGGACRARRWLPT